MYVTYLCLVTWRDHYYTIVDHNGRLCPADVGNEQGGNNTACKLDIVLHMTYLQSTLVDPN